MSTLAEQESLGKRLLRWYLPTILVVGVLTLSGGAWAAGSLVVSPSTNLTDRKSVV